MAEVVRHRSAPQLTWANLLKVIVAGFAIYLWFLLWRVVLLVIVALILAAGVLPAVAWLERKGWPRWVAAGGMVLLIVGGLAGFLALSWSAASAQAQSLIGQTQSIEQQLTQWVPGPIVDAVIRSGQSSVASVASYVQRFAATLLSTLAFVVFGLILVLYLLLEREATYQWVRAFIPAANHQQFDRTAVAAQKAAAAYVVGNLATSVCAALYVFVVLGLLKVPGLVLLAVAAFVADFVPVLGFFIAAAPAMIMAASVSGTMVLLMIPVYVFYHFIENYFIGPYVYGNRLRLSNVAVLLAFAVGAELAGVVGALVALPLAAIYPSIERVWLSDRLAEDVVAEHDRVAGRANSH